MIRILTNAVTVLATLVLLGGMAVTAEEEVAPRIEIDQPDHHAGTLARGEEYLVVYTIRNSGTADLRLLRADGNCSCIGTAILQPVVPPGETGEVEVAYLSRTAAGRTSRTIELTTNDPNNRVSHLHFSADVAVPFGFATPAMDLGTIHHQAAEPLTATTQLLLDESDKRPLPELETSSPQISARFTGMEELLDGHRRLAMEVSLRPGPEPGPQRETVTAVTPSGGHPPAILLVSALVAGDVEVTPHTLRLMVIRTDKRQPKDDWKRIYLTGHAAEKKLALFDCRDNNELLGLDLVELIPGEEFELTVTLGAEALPEDTEISGTITVATNSPTQPLLSIEYQAVNNTFHKLDQRVEETEQAAEKSEEEPEGETEGEVIEEAEEEAAETE